MSITAQQIEYAQAFANRVGVGLEVDGKLGPNTRRFVATFQDAYQLDGTRLAHDGIPGQATAEAMLHCRENGYRLSANFTVAEFLTKGDRRVTAQNPVFLVTRGQVAALQRLRDMIGRPLYLLSTYRDPAHNRTVGGAANSMHLYGAAADIDRPRTGREVTEAEARACGFTGIGMLSKARPGRDVIHVDTRPSVARWFYT